MTATATHARGVWTAAAAVEAIERRNQYALLHGPDRTPPPTCPAPTLAERMAPIAQLHQRCPSCGAFCGVDRIANQRPEELHPAPGEPCPFPTAPRDRYASESLATYLRRVEGWYRLRQTLRPGDTVFTILRSVSRSGMLRRISLVLLEDGTPWHLDAWASWALDYSLSPTAEGLPVTGCGMDMGYHLVDSLSWALYGRGYVLRHRWM